MSIKIPTPFMQTSQKQQIQLSQRLIMTAQMQQALRILQLPLQELEPFIEEQVVLNPILEIVDHEVEHDLVEYEISQNKEEENEVIIDDQDFTILTRLEDEWRDHFAENEPLPIKRSSEEEKLRSYHEQLITAHPNLHDSLLQQVGDSFENLKEKEIAQVLIGYIDEAGFLKTPFSEICLLHQFHEEEVQLVLKEIQTFEPYGVGASTIQESLLIQLQCLGKEKTLAYKIVKDHYESLLHHHLPIIQKKLNVSYEKIQKAIENDIAKLDLHPGTQFSPQSFRFIIPDVTIRQENDKLFVEVERDSLPRMRLNSRYLKMLQDASVSNETKHFIKHHLFSARWLERNIQQRFSTIERIVQVLIEKQYQFFIHPDGKLLPLTMSSVAEELNLHESTIARTVSNKFLHSPRGLFPLRAFFTNGYVSQEGKDLSSTTVKQVISELIVNEDKCQPLSDERISFLLKQKGVNCARRTVAKYRMILKIGNARQRRRFC